MRQNRFSNLKLQRAFTLIELLITVAVLGVLMAIAVPNLRDFVVSNRLSSQVNGFIGLINYARSEAIARNQSVLICAKRAADNECSNAQSWANLETQVFVDVDGNNSWSTGDISLKRIAPLDTTETQTFFSKNASGNPSFIDFGASGSARNLHTFHIHAINDSDSEYEAKYGRTICIPRSGRARVTPLSLNLNCPAF